jgi:para-aminobenzoate synthetase component I
MRPLASFHLLEPLHLEYPLDRYAPAFGRRKGTFLLDGAGGPHDGALARHAILGAEPFRTFRATRISERDERGRRRSRVVASDDHGGVDAIVDDPLAVLRALLAETRIDPSAYRGQPLPLMAGAVGYVGYEAGQMLERLPGSDRPRAGMPDIAFAFHSWVLGTSKADGKSWLSVLGRGASEGDARTDAERTRERVLRIVDRVHRTARDEHEPAAILRVSDRDVQSILDGAGLRASVARDGYVRRVERAKKHITRGDAFEICLTAMLEGTFPHDAWELYRELRRANPAPFAAWLDLPEGAIASSSPERFVRLDARRIAESRPIKGTRPRGRTEADDERIARELASSPKDRAENAMIVDLVRNDLGKVCRFGSVETPELYAVERYPTVHQLVSTVRGELAKGRDAVDLLSACFPPGSMTGAPKIEAMTILEALEPVERGVYSGALGFIDASGTMDASVVIRSAVVRDGKVSVGIGGAVVADSDPAAEHAEALLKAKALAEAIANVASRARERDRDRTRLVDFVL